MKPLNLFLKRLTYPFRLLLAILISSKVLKEYMTYGRFAMWHDIAPIKRLVRGLQLVITLLEG